MRVRPTWIMRKRSSSSSTKHPTRFSTVSLTFRAFHRATKTQNIFTAEIRDRGAKFTELEYRYLLSLAVRSHGHHELHSLEHCQTRLRDIMKQQRDNKTVA